MRLGEIESYLPLLLGFASGAALLVASWLIARNTVRQARSSARRLLSDTLQEAESRANDIVVSAQERALSLQEEASRREQELDAREAAVEARGRQVESRASDLERERRELDRRRAAVGAAEQRLREAEAAVEARRREAEQAVERIAGLSREQARIEIFSQVEQTTRRDAVRLSRRILDEAREKAEAEALRLIVAATHRLSLREALESTVSLVRLPNDEMKGRIIGKEGRNIRALEMATGIDVIVDDTPGAILLSSFDPLRRELARIAIERLVEDGRIHPARIEETVAKVREEADRLIEETGAQAAFEVGVSDLHPRLVKLVGRLKFRTHHGQNLLRHALETALLAGYMASEVDARQDVARRAGLLHEVGRADEAESGHPLLASAELAARYGQSEEVVHAIRSLHPDTDPRTVEAVLVRVANRISESRPGARKDNLEVFIERLRRLEAIAMRFDGVVRAYAVKAGREIRVLVDPGATRDEHVYGLARTIARAIEKELDYTGQIRVSVVRETRAVEFAV